MSKTKIDNYVIKTGDIKSNQVTQRLLLYRGYSWSKDKHPGYTHTDFILDCEYIVVDGKEFYTKADLTNLEDITIFGSNSAINSLLNNTM